MEAECGPHDSSSAPPYALDTQQGDQNSNTDSPVSSIDGLLDLNNTTNDQEAVPYLTSIEQLKLLAKLEEANRKIECDAKSAMLPSHSRRGSDTSQTSILSATNSINEAEGTASASALSASGEENLWNVWGGIVANWETEWKKRNEFIRDLVRQGVPVHFRGIVWQLLSGADSSREKKLYAAYIKANSACEKVIKRDVVRTYPNHDLFKEKDGAGQEALFNVMKAYSLYDREVGYCQGSCFIVGLLLMQMPEEEAFAVLIQIMQKHRMREMYKPSMAELELKIYQFEHIVQDTLPEIHAHFAAQNFNTSIFASNWFLTLFTTTLSQPLACRIMDIFLLDGIEIIFKVALALLILGKEQLLSLDMDNILKYMQKQLPAKAESCPDSFMNLVYTIKLNPKKLKKYEKDYLAFKAKQQNDTAILRNLRQENRILQQRVEMLEKESSELAEKLVRGQVDRAEGAEETFALAREVQALRHAHLEAQQMLASAQEEIRSLTSLEEINSRQAALEAAEAASDPRQELVLCLQKELIRVRLQAAEYDEVEKKLEARIAELKNENKQLRGQPVDNNVAHLQEELIAARLNEAEAHLALKEVRKRLSELKDEWHAHLQEHKQEVPAAAGPSNVVSDIMATPKKLLRVWDGRSEEAKKLCDQLITAKLNDAETTMELKELRLKIMHLEAQAKISTNQLKRQDNEIKALRETADLALERERVLLAKQKEAEHQYNDLETKYKYEKVQAQIKAVEAAQRIAELENELSDYKVMNQVKAAEGELRANKESVRMEQLVTENEALKDKLVKMEGNKTISWSNVSKLKFDSDDEDEEQGDAFLT